MHSAEWLRGAIHVAKDCEEPVAVAYYTKLLAEAESREAGEPSTECLMQILRDGQADHWAATCGSDEGGFQPSEWVLEAEKVLAWEYSGSGFAEQLAAAQAEAKERTTMAARAQEAMRYLLNGLPATDAIWAAYGNADSARAWLSDRDARMKRQGAAEWLEAAAREGGYYERSSEGMREEAAQLRQQAEAARLAEGE